jgi:hypothetical protein
MLSTPPRSIVKPIAREPGMPFIPPSWHIGTSPPGEAGRAALQALVRQRLWEPQIRRAAEAGGFE